MVRCKQSCCLKKVSIFLIICLSVLLLLEILTQTCSHFKPASEADVENKMRMLSWKLEYNHDRLLDTKKCQYEAGFGKVSMALGQLLRKGKIQKLENGIPQLLHTTWKTQRLLNDEWEVIDKVCKSSNANFTFCHWDDEELEIFVASFYPSFLSKYLSYPYPIQRADAGRYLLLHQFGGFYKDTNIGCSTPFELLVRHVAFSRAAPFKVLLYSPSAKALAADFFASTPKHPLFSHLLQKLQATPSRVGLPYLDVMMATGPMFLASSLSSFFAHENISTQTKEDIAFISRKMFREVYFYFGQGGTWHCVDGHVIWWLWQHSFHILLAFLAFLLIALICFLSSVVLFHKKIR